MVLVSARNNACVTKLESFQLVAWATIIDFDYRNIHLSKYSPLHDILLVLLCQTLVCLRKEGEEDYKSRHTN